MKKLLVLVILIFSFISCTKKDTTVYLPYDEINFIDDNIVVYQDGKSAILDKNGKIILPFIDGYITYVYDDVLVVQGNNNKYSLVNRKGKNILGKQEYKYLRVYDDKTFAVGKELFGKRKYINHKGEEQKIEEKKDIYKNRQIQKEGYKKYSLIDTKTNKVLVSIGRYDSISKFNKFDLSRVSRGYNQNGFIDLDGKELIPCIYDNFHLLDIGLIAFKTKKNLWGLMDKTGKIVLKAQYDDIDNTSFSKDVAKIRLDRRYGFIDKNLKEVLAPKYEYIGKFDRIKGLAQLELNGLKTILNDKFQVLFEKDNYDKIYASYQVKDYLEVEKNKLHGLFTKDAKMIIPVKYKSILKMEDGYIKVVDDKNNYGIYDKNGKLVIPVTYRTLWYMDDIKSFVYTTKDGDKGIITLNAEEISLKDYKDFYAISKDLFLVKKEKSGIIDKNKKVILPFEYEKLSYLSKDKLLFKKDEKDEKWGIINTKGDIILKPSFYLYKDSSYGIPKNLLMISQEHKVGFLDKDTGKIVIKPKYRTILRKFKNQEEKFATVLGKKDSCIVNLTKKKEIIPCKYEEFAKFKNGYFIAFKGKHWAIYTKDGEKLFEKKEKKSKS